MRDHESGAREENKLEQEALHLKKIIKIKLCMHEAQWNTLENQNSNK